MCRRATCASSPIGTGPFKFVEFKPNELIKVDAKPGLLEAGPALSRRHRIHDHSRTCRRAILAFVAGKFDMTSPYGVTIPLLKDIKSQAPQAICELTPTNVSRNLIVNRDKPPFDNPELRRAMALTLDRKAFIDILTEGKGDIGGAMLPPPEGFWGMPPEMLQDPAGLRPRRAKNRAEARKIMEKLGYGPDKRLAVTVSTRNIPPYRDPAVILIDQLKEIYIDGELEPIDTDQWYPKVMRKDYHGRPQRHRERPRRPRPATLRELRLRRGAQLHRLLQSRARQAGRPAIDGSRPGEAQAAGVGDRAQAGGGRRPADDLLPARRRPAGSPMSRG